MNIGIPKERRPFEYRVGLSPAGVQILTQNNHKVYIEHEAGIGAGFGDVEYEQAGGIIAYSPEEVFGRADLLLKTARPTEEEMEWLRPGSALAGILSLPSANQQKIKILLDRKITAIAYEQICEPDGTLPVLRPFSQIGGAMAVEIAARLLQNPQGGRGVLLGGIPGVPPAEVVILGAGVLGTYAAQSFLGVGAHVTVVDKGISALQKISQISNSIVTLLSTDRNILRSCEYADVLLGAVLVPGSRAPILVTREMVRKMKPRSVIIDMSIDEGGCVETSHPTTHDQPTFIEENVIHYCVPNTPGVVARTAVHSFVNVAMPYILEIANLGIEKAMKKNPSIELAINTHGGKILHLSRLTE